MRRSIDIDGELVFLDCQSLTVQEYSRIIELGYQRGAEDTDLQYQERITMLDQYVTSLDVMLDDKLVACLASAFAGRPDVVKSLYFALRNAQELSVQEADDLETGARFIYWLDEARGRDSSSHWIQTGTSCDLCRAENLCEKRGCNGQFSKQVVWHDEKFVLFTCPILSLKPHIENTIRLFHGTHRFEGGVWVQEHFVRSGGYDQQDVWLNSALRLLRRVHRDLVLKK